MEQPFRMKVTVLGSGTSTGVPTLGCECAICTSDDPIHHRSRASVLIESPHLRGPVVIDTAPEFRLQMLKARVKSLRAILYTHLHADHCHGFDDIRPFLFKEKKPIDCFLREDLHEEMKVRFAYAFVDTGYLGALPKVNLEPVPELGLFRVDDVDVEAVTLPHGSVRTTAYRFGDFVYATDFKGLPESIQTRWQGKVKYMIASGVRFQQHHTHNTVMESVEMMQRLGVQKGYITHLSHDIDYKRDRKRLPPHIDFAYDGLQWEIMD
ncbi:MAG: MBL fold metallo-hydrolase [Zetaproteobacteria bacterium]|nr:MBL fold metallo-hydrolase [Zetaproteobacteria bacterium]